MKEKKERSLEGHEERETHKGGAESGRRALFWKKCDCISRGNLNFLVVRKCRSLTFIFEYYTIPERHSLLYLKGI
jgi:hypothetical protein